MTRGDAFPNLSPAFSLCIGTLDCAEQVILARSCKGPAIPPPSAVCHGHLPRDSRLRTVSDELFALAGGKSSRGAEPRAAVTARLPARRATDLDAERRRGAKC